MHPLRLQARGSQPPQTEPSPARRHAAQSSGIKQAWASPSSPINPPPSLTRPEAVAALCRSRACPQGSCPPTGGQAKTWSYSRSQTQRGPPSPLRKMKAREPQVWGQQWPITADSHNHGGHLAYGQMAPLASFHEHHRGTELCLDFRACFSREHHQHP